MGRRWILLLAMVLMVPAISVGADPPNPFVGSWEGMDPAPDNSRNRLLVGSTLHVVYHEDGLTACEIAHGQFVGGTGTATAEIDGDTLTFTMDVYCNLRGGKRLPVGPFDFEFTYNSASDTLTTSDGIVYNRPGS